MICNLLRISWYIYFYGLSDIKSPGAQHLLTTFRITSGDPLRGDCFAILVKLGWYNLTLLHLLLLVTWFALAVPCDDNVEVW